jgi:acetyl esterase
MPDNTLDEIRQNGVGRTVSEELLAMFEVGFSEERMIPTRDGDTHVFVYCPNVPPDKKVVLPLYVNIHGGGFVKGHRQQDIVFCKNICSQVGCVVVDVDYATAPEQKYPYALHQCYDVVKWAYRHPEALGIDKDRIAVGAARAATSQRRCALWQNRPGILASNCKFSTTRL